MNVPYSLEEEQQVYGTKGFGLSHHLYLEATLEDSIPDIESFKSMFNISLAGKFQYSQKYTSSILWRDLCTSANFKTTSDHFFLSLLLKI